MIVFRRIPRPRFSLRALLLMSVASCLVMAWIAHHHNQYVAEQKLVDSLIEDAEKSERLAWISVNGKQVAAANTFMVPM